jgi:hypothetical protein
MLANQGQCSHEEILQARTVLNQFANLTIIAGW